MVGNLADSVLPGVEESKVQDKKKITLTVNEVAELIGVSTSTVYTMTRLNEIPHKKVRGRILFHRKTIEQWLTNELVH